MDGTARCDWFQNGDRTGRHVRQLIGRLARLVIPLMRWNGWGVTASRGALNAWASPYLSNQSFLNWENRAECQAPTSGAGIEYFVDSQVAAVPEDQIVGPPQ